MNIKPILSLSLVVFSMLAVSLEAAVTPLFFDAADLAGIDNVQSDGSTYIVDVFDGSATIGDGDGLRVADFSTDDKPEAFWDVPAITTGLRIDLSAYNLNWVDDSHDINLRFGNPGVTPTSNAKTWTTISFEQSHRLKISGSTQAEFGDVTTGANPVPLDLSFVINNGLVDLDYIGANGVNKTLGVGMIDTYVDGVLEDADRVLGAGTDVVYGDGVGRLGFIGSSDGDDGMSYLYDNVVLYTGDDISIPEPTSIVLLCGALISLGMARRRS
jgi:hypothetical protein